VKLEDLMTNVAPEWRSAFVRFVETGEADEAFLNHLDRDEETQAAVERAFSEQSKALEGLAQALRESDTALAAQAPRPRAVDTVEMMTRSFETAVHLPPVERHAMFEAAITKASQGLAAKGERQGLRETLSDLKQAVVAAQAAVLEK
jgi:hypothetical protein